MIGDLSFQNESINGFFEKIKNWIDSTGLNIKIDQDPELIESIFNIGDLSSLSIDELNNANLSIIRFVYGLQTELNECKTILDFANDSIYYIICDMEISDADKYLKAEEKYNKRIKSCPMCVELNKLRLHASARVNLLNSKIEIINRLSDNISQIIKRKGYRNEH